MWGCLLPFAGYLSGMTTESVQVYLPMTSSSDLDGLMKFLSSNMNTSTILVGSGDGSPSYPTVAFVNAAIDLFLLRVAVTAMCDAIEGSGIPAKHMALLRGEVDTMRSLIPK